MERRPHKAQDLRVSFEKSDVTNITGDVRQVCHQAQTPAQT